MTQPRRTLQKLTEQVAIRTGFVATGQASTINDPLFHSLLQDAVLQLHDQLPQDMYRERNGMWDTEQGVEHYPIPADCDPLRIEMLWVSNSSGWWIPLKRGVTELSRSWDEESLPCYWDIGVGDETSEPGMIQLWPIPDDVYTIRMDYYRDVGAFADPDDLCPIYPDNLVFLHALANAKAHFGQNDAQVYFAQLESQLLKARGNQLRGKRFVRGTPYDDHDLGEVGSDTKYTKRHSANIIVDESTLLSEQGAHVLVEESS